MKLPDSQTLGALYDDLYRRSPFADSPAFYRWVLSRAQPEKGARLLDIGCGIGGALVAGEEAGLRTVGLDLSREALRQARARTRTTEYVQADGARLPFADRSFDVLLNLGNLEHFRDLEGGVREMRRVLKDDGEGWVLLPNLFYSGTLWRAIRSGYGPDHHQPIDRFATRNEWRDLLQSGGLEVVRSIPYHKGKWWKRLLPANLAWHFLFQVRRSPAGTNANSVPFWPLERVREMGQTAEKPPEGPAD